MPFKVRPPLYTTWVGMKNRCNWPKHVSYMNYGGRGIQVCERWNSYYMWYADIGRLRPSPNHVLDRIDNDGNYTPENTRWVLRKRSQRHQRRTRMVVIAGKEYIAADLSEKYGIKTDTIVARAKEGLSFKACVNLGKLNFKTGDDPGFCINGHAYTPENTRIYGAQRACIICVNENRRKRRALQRQRSVS